MSCQQCPGLCSSHGTCLSTAVDPIEAETPSWNEFFGMYLLWPAAVQITISVFFQVVRPIYSAIRDSSTGFRIFLQRFIGMPDKLRVTCPYPMVLIQLLRLAFALAQGYLFAYRTYTKGRWNQNNVAVWELGISCFFIFTHLLERLSEGFQIRFLNPKALVDVFVITPIFIPYGLDLQLVAVERRWLCLSYFRIITALGAFRSLQRLTQEHSQHGDTVLGRCVLTVLRLTTMIVCMAGTMFVLEVLGEVPGLEDTFLTVGMGDLSIVQMIYWITTTISTVGYGDFSPTTVPSRIMIIFFIFGGVIFFGSETAEILEIFTDAEEGRGSYVNRWLRWKLFIGKSRMRTQIVITGNGCHMSSPLMETLLLETLTVTDDQWNVERPDLVFLSDKEYDFDLKAFVETELGPGQAEKVYFLRGSVLNSRDLERAQIQTSRLCFVIPDYTAEEAFEEDSANIMMSLSMLRHSPGLRLRLMLLQPEGRLRANKMGIPRERCFSAEEMKCALFAQSTRIRGLITLLSGLLQVHTNFTDQHLSMLRKQFPEHWRIPYSESLRWNICGFLLHDCYGNRSFASVLDEIYRESNGTVMLIAAVHRGRLVLNYEKVLEPGQVVVVFAKGPKAFARFAKATGRNEEKEQWTSQFLKERTHRLEMEAYETFQELKKKDKMHLQQQGRRQKHLSDGDNMQTKSIFEVTGAEAFKLLDKNNDGRLDKEEFEKALQEQLASDQSNTPDIEELRECKELTLLLVRDCQGVWQEVDCFLQLFRNDRLYETLLPKPPIVVLSQVETPEEVLLKWESKTCCFLKGSILNTRNLEGAGIRNAANIISIGRKVFAKDSNLPDPALGDSDSVELCGAVEQALADSLRTVERGQLQLFEFSYTRSVFLMSRIDRNCVEMGQMRRNSRMFASETSGVTENTAEREEVMVTKNGGSDKELLILNESFAAGQAFTLDFFGGLFGRIYRFPAAIEFLDAIANPNGRRQSSRMWQTMCPAAWIDRTFGELVHALVTGEDRQAFGNFTGCCIPVALYRESRRRFLPPGCAGFNCTGPPMHTRLEAEDFITILGDENFGRAAYKAGLFDRADPGPHQHKEISPATIELLLRDEAPLNL